MAFLSSITIPETSWIWLAVAFLTVVLVLLIWNYRRANKLHPGNTIPFLLKLFAVLILLACLIEPLWIGRRAKSGANLFVVLADNSSGMNIVDQGMDKSRAEILQETLDYSNAKWLSDIGGVFQLRQYVFDSRLSRTTDFEELTFDGNNSSIGTHLRTITERYKNRPLAGIMLLSDGIATDMDNQDFDFSDVPPVYPVIIGGDRPKKDISLHNISITQTVFEDSPVNIKADIDTAGYIGKTVEISLLDDSGGLVESQTKRIQRNGQEQAFDFRLKPEETGILFYDVEVKERSNTPDDEATMLNNNRTIVVDRGGGPYRILYVAGRLNWEYKFLRRAVTEDPQVELIALLRVARREPKFNWLGHAGERTNPLYRGFENEEDEDAEQYDQPVLVRLGTEDANELVDGFPIIEKELFGYHAVIIDDLEAEFLTTEQMSLIRKFVSERGGGFIMLGGLESFQKGGFERTAISEILPVRLDRLPEEQLPGQLRLNLTREGWLQPWARLRDNRLDEEYRFLDMPEFKVLNRLESVKVGASVIANISNDYGQELPALVVQRFGKGRTAALTVGDIWRWGMKETAMHEDMDKFWRQTLRWLIADVSERITLEVNQKPDQTNQPVVFQVNVNNENFLPMDNVAVKIDVFDPYSQQISLDAKPVLDKTGVFEATYIPRISGGYYARALVTDFEGMEQGQAEIGWVADLEALEFKSTRVNRSLLENIAQRTGGSVLEIDNLSSFARTLPSRDAPITEVWIRPLWDLHLFSLAIFLFVCVCFIGEWALRRWKGIP